MTSPYAQLTPSMTHGQQLARWREATGQANPTTVPLQVRATVGNLTLTVAGDKLPPAAVGMVKALAAGKRRKVKPKRHPGGTPVTLLALLPPGVYASAKHDIQRAECRRAIRTGEWAPLTAAA